MDALIVSTALDTNGQNGRYKRAADRHGGDPRLLALIVGRQDPAGVAGRFKAAADRSGELRIRSAHKRDAYMAFPGDIHWSSRTKPLVAQLFRDADVVHLNNSYRAYRELGGPKLHKPALLHHHGTLFRNGPEPLLREAHRYGMVQAVSTHDLLRVAPDELTWLPSAYDVDELEARPRGRPADGRILVVSCPTNRDHKSTEQLIAAIAALQAEGLPVDLELVEGQPWTVAMARKARADIYFDQVKLGYGCNAIEAWGMGIPVIAGADDWTLAAMLAEFGQLPFYAATETTIADRIRDLAGSADLRAEWGQRGLAHARRFHDELPALERLVSLYVRAIGDGPAQRAARSGGGRGGTFRSTRYAGLRIRLDKKASVRFRGTDLRLGPEQAWMLREAIAAQPGLGVVEVGPDGTPLEVPRSEP